jgi:hypothetical protein
MCLHTQATAEAGNAALAQLHEVQQQLQQQQELQQELARQQRSQWQQEQRVQEVGCCA